AEQGRCHPGGEGTAGVARGRPPTTGQQQLHGLVAEGAERGQRTAETGGQQRLRGPGQSRRRSGEEPQQQAAGHVDDQGAQRQTGAAALLRPAVDQEARPGPDRSPESHQQGAHHRSSSTGAPRCSTSPVRPMAAAVATRQHRTLPTAKTTASSGWARSWRTSMTKVEKVVKPPSTPTPRNGRSNR